MMKISGKGSVRQIRNRWQCVVTVIDSDARRRSQRTKMTEILTQGSTGRNRSRALKELERFRAEVQRELDAKNESRARDIKEPSCTLVDGIQGYIDYLRRTGKISAKTAEGYGYSLKHIRRGFPDIPAEELSAADAMGWISESIESGVSNGVMHKAYKLLNQYFRFLVTTDDPVVRSNPLMRNPMSVVPAPRHPDPPPNPLQRGLIASLNSHMQAQEDGYLRRSVMIALNTGMRLGEVAALMWVDIDWDARELTVRHSASRVRGERIEIKATKGRERRVVPLDSLIYDLLREARRTDLSALAGMGVEDPEGVMARSFVVSGPGAAALDPKTIGKRFSGFARAARMMGIEHRPVTFHGLRHTFATQWVARGGDVAALSDILGHKDVTVTLNIYASSDPVGKRSGIASAAPVLTEGWRGRPEARGA